MNSYHSQISERAVAYLERIGYTGSINRSATVLANLHEHHMYAVPYENMDILNGIPLSLDLDDLYDKIVIRSRGGYCFELNALFGWLLGELGFQVTSYFGRFWRDEPNPPPLRRHHILRVKAEGQSYICDVGVGGIVPIRPLLLVEGLEQQLGGEYYRLDRDPFYGWILSERKAGEWSRIYSFTEEPQLPRDFEMASYWCEHAPESIFTKSAMVFIRTREGRNTMAGDEFRIFTSEGVETFTPSTQEEYRQAMQTYFGISISD
ncbi:arylamine N-acetyltransferase [Paenibacillus sp.]|jgi:N-hydroxyarylamine O-acetyltransferase|uniref:arylamine N-acetyltransferase family protein n=1 Tax=Paenibacillus sp. TaxID=58172 RepID=UPI00281FDA86|nr:arylamine N-acetyltransferase [Paenibacillus sp.]MDR0271502.1 arylamine N-acetyltransferase [Paenibacillus sp.]